MMVTMIGDSLYHLRRVAADRFGLAALLGADAGVGAGVSTKVNRKREFVGERLHRAQRLTVALGAGHAPVATLSPWCRDLLVADHHAALAIKLGQAADDGCVVGIGAVAMQLDEIGEQAVGVVSVWGRCGCRATCAICGA